MAQRISKTNQQMHPVVKILIILLILYMVPGLAITATVASILPIEAKREYLWIAGAATSLGLLLLLRIIATSFKFALVLFVALSVAIAAAYGVAGAVFEKEFPVRHINLLIEERHLPPVLQEQSNPKRNEAYLKYVAVTSDSEQHCRWRFFSSLLRIDEYDGYYDLDFVIQAWIQVKSTVHGSLEFSTPAEKGGAPSCVLLWELERQASGLG